MGMKRWLYRNKRNDRKHIEVRRYSDGHYVARGVIIANGVTNYVTKKLCRYSKKWLDTLLADYVEVTV